MSNVTRVKRGAPALLDHSCQGVVLAVDTARISGWAVRLQSKLRYSGQLDTLDPAAIDAAVLAALSVSRAAYCKRAPVLVLEKPWGGRMATVLALGQARERWLAAWDRAGLSRRRVVSVPPSTWRARVLGHGATRLERDAIREREMLSARAECAAGMQLGADEAAAILISRWAVRAPAVALMHGGKRS